MGMVNVDLRRRQLIAGATVVAAAPQLLLPGRGVRAQSASLAAESLHDDVTVVYGPDSNALVCDTSEGVADRFV